MASSACGGEPRVPSAKVDRPMLRKLVGESLRVIIARVAAGTSLGLPRLGGARGVRGVAEAAATVRPVSLGLADGVACPATSPGVRGSRCEESRFQEARFGPCVPRPGKLLGFSGMASATDARRDRAVLAKDLRVILAMAAGAANIRARVPALAPLVDKVGMQSLVTPLAVGGELQRAFSFSHRGCLKRLRRERDKPGPEPIERESRGSGGRKRGLSSCGRDEESTLAGP